VIRKPTVRVVGLLGAIDEARLIVPEYLPGGRDAAPAGSMVMNAVEGLMPDDGDTTSQGSDVVAVQEAVGFSVFVTRRGSGGVTYGAPEPRRWRANSGGRDGASVATGGPFCAISTRGDVTNVPILVTCTPLVACCCVVFGGTAKVTVAGNVVPLAPETIVTPSTGRTS
jgi:hypothetical protein